MNENQTVLNISEKMLTINGESHHLKLEGKLGCYRVIAAESFVVPPRSEMVAFCDVCVPTGESLPTGEFGIVEPKSSFLESNKGLIGRTLVQNNTKVPVRFMNLSADANTIYKGTNIGHLSQVSQMVGGHEKASDKQSWPKEFLTLKETTMSKLNDTQKAKVEPFLTKYASLFAGTDDNLGRTDVVKHNIKTGDATPIKQPPRRLPVHRRNEVDKLVDDMLERGVIEPSSSPWASGVVLVKKKDGTTRFCVDYRRLNDVTLKDAYPLPRIDDMLDSLSGASWFSTLDLCMGYWQVEMEPSDKPKTAFTTRKGLYQFKVMPFGLCNAGATFERLMETVLSGLNWEICLIYLDDIIVISKTFEGMMDNLSQVFERLQSAGLKLKAKKCSLFCRSVEYLGHIISAEGVATDKRKTEVVSELSAPANVSELRSFLGLCGYYRKFVRDFAKIAKPLHRLTEKNKAFIWNNECQTAFDKLKESLTSSPILAHPNFDNTFILDTDASNFAIGAVLSQVNEGQERVVAYASRTLTKSERHYCVTRKELLAVVHFTKYFKHYLYGQKFILRTDHNSLRWLTNFKAPEGQLARWLEVLSTYDMEVQHRPGKQHQNADAMSRLPCNQCGFNDNLETLENVPQARIAAVETLDFPYSYVQKIQCQDKDLDVVKKW